MSGEGTVEVEEEGWEERRSLRSRATEAAKGAAKGWDEEGEMRMW